MLPPTPPPCQVNASTTGLLKPIQLANFLWYHVRTGGMKIVILYGSKSELERSRYHKNQNDALIDAL